MENMVFALPGYRAKKASKTTEISGDRNNKATLPRTIPGVLSRVLRIHLGKDKQKSIKL